eukprot:gene25618-biopygen16509
MHIWVWTRSVKRHAGDEPDRTARRRDGRAHGVECAAAPQRGRRAASRAGGWVGGWGLIRAIVCQRARSVRTRGRTHTALAQARARGLCTNATSCETAATPLPLPYGVARTCASARAACGRAAARTRRWRRRARAACARTRLRARQRQHRCRTRTALPEQFRANAHQVRMGICPAPWVCFCIIWEAVAIKSGVLIGATPFSCGAPTPPTPCPGGGSCEERPHPACAGSSPASPPPFPPGRCWGLWDWGGAAGLPSGSPGSPGGAVSQVPASRWAALLLGRPGTDLPKGSAGAHPHAQTSIWRTPTGQRLRKPHPPGGNLWSLAGAAGPPRIPGIPREC